MPDPRDGSIPVEVAGSSLLQWRSLVHAWSCRRHLLRSTPPEVAGSGLFWQRSLLAIFKSSEDIACRNPFLDAYGLQISFSTIPLSFGIFG